MNPDHIYITRKSLVGALSAVSAGMAGYAALSGSTMTMIYGLTLATVGVGFGAILVGVGVGYGVAVLMGETPSTTAMQVVSESQDVASLIDIKGTAMAGTGLPSSFTRLDMATFLLDKALENAERTLRVAPESQPVGLYFQPVMEPTGRYVDANGVSIEITW